MSFRDSAEGQTHYFGDDCIPPHEPLPQKAAEEAIKKGFPSTGPALIEHWQQEGAREVMERVASLRDERDI